MQARAAHNWEPVSAFVWFQFRPNIQFRNGFQLAKCSVWLEHSAKVQPGQTLAQLQQVFINGLEDGRKIREFVDMWQTFGSCMSDSRIWGHSRLACLRLEGRQLIETPRDQLWTRLRSRRVSYKRRRGAVEVLNRVVEVWNSLPDCVSFESLSAFKRTISAVNFTGFLKCV